VHRAAVVEAAGVELLLYLQRWALIVGLWLSDKAPSTSCVLLSLSIAWLSLIWYNAWSNGQRKIGQIGTVFPCYSFSYRISLVCL
jgi:hypothetical protein